MPSSAIAHMEQEEGERCIKLIFLRDSTIPRGCPFESNKPRRVASSIYLAVADDRYKNSLMANSGKIKSISSIKYDYDYIR